MRKNNQFNIDRRRVFQGAAAIAGASAAGTVLAGGSPSKSNASLTKKEQEAATSVEKLAKSIKNYLLDNKLI